MSSRGQHKCKLFHYHALCIDCSRLMLQSKWKLHFFLFPMKENKDTVRLSKCKWINLASYKDCRSWFKVAVRGSKWVFMDINDVCHPEASVSLGSKDYFIFKFVLVRQYSEAQSSVNNTWGTCGQLQHSGLRSLPPVTSVSQIIHLTTWTLCAVSKEPFNLQAVEMITCTMFWTH